MRSIYLFLSALLFSYSVFSQENRKYWRDGELTWDDFQESFTVHITGSELAYAMYFETKKERSGDTIIFRNKAEAYVDKSESWVHTYLKNENTLHYNQVIFDLLEIYRRKLQKELDSSTPSSSPHLELHKIFGYFKDRVSNFKIQSDMGTKKEIVEVWKNNVRKELDDYPENYFPSFERKNFGLAWHVGMGTGYLSNTLNDLFTPPINFMYGFDFGYKRSVIYLVASLGWNKVNEPFYHEQEYWEQKHDAGIAILDLTYGYSFIDNAKIKLSPFAGIGLTEFSTRTKDPEQKSNAMVNWNFTGGINLDYKIRKVVKLAGNIYGSKWITERSLRVRFYSTRAYYSSAINGFTYNLSVGYSVFGNALKFEK